MINTKQRAVGYIRVSTKEQAREGISLEAQSERIKALAVAKGWVLQGMIQDRGYSGKDLNRPGVQDLIRRCEAGDVDVVIVYKVDRLTRNQKHLWQFLEDVLEPQGVGFISVSEPFDTTTATGKAFLGMLGVLRPAGTGIDRRTHQRGAEAQEVQWGVDHPCTDRLPHERIRPVGGRSRRDQSDPEGQKTKPGRKERTGHCPAHEPLQKHNSQVVTHRSQDA